jgi:hypothetical protein
VTQQRAISLAFPFPFIRAEAMMNHAYIIKTSDGYLYPFAGDVSLTDDESQAGRFDSTDEARKTAEERGYYDGRFEIIRIDLDDSD